MGKASDPMAVVDPHAKVYGVRNLRVVDASAFPFLPPGHAQAIVCESFPPFPFLLNYSLSTPSSLPFLLSFHSSSHSYSMRMSSAPLLIFANQTLQCRGIFRMANVCCFLSAVDMLAEKIADDIRNGR